MTRCSSEREFIDRFASFARETEVVVPALPHVTEGTSAQFVILLNDHSIVMKGWCEVLEVGSLMRMRLCEMDAHTCGIHLRLMERHASLDKGPEAHAVGADLALPASALGDFDAADLASFVQPAGPEQPAEVVPSVPTMHAITHLDRVRRIARRSAAYASGMVVALALGSVLMLGLKASILDRAPSVARSSTAGASAPGTESAASRDCVARVTTTPAGAAVLWGDMALGSSPIEHAEVPCGTAVVTLRHERYSEVTRTITSEQGRSAVVVERLSRPPAKLVVTSSPPNALIKLNERAIGPAPRAIATLRFEHVRIEASLPGYQTWKKTLYLKDSESTIDVTLVPAPDPNKRADAAPTAAPLIALDRSREPVL